MYVRDDLRPIPDTVFSENRLQAHDFELRFRGNPALRLASKPGEKTESKEFNPLPESRAPPQTGIFG
jgi:hypothetical protein